MDLNFTAGKEILHSEVRALLVDKLTVHQSDKVLKGTIERIGKLVAEGNVQMQGGIGMSWELLLPFIVLGKQVVA